MGKRRSLFQFLTLGFIVVGPILPMPSYGWNAVGHEVIAEVAWEKLTPKARLVCSKLLESNPAHNDNNFILAAIWADQTKNRTTAQWHFIDQYWSRDGTAVLDHPQPKNVVWAISHFAAIFGNHFRAAPARAEALRYIEHFVGDVHQPLHCSSMVDAIHPYGDKGGNEWLFKRKGDRHHGFRELHQLWDEGGGLFPAKRMPPGQFDSDQIKALAKEAVASLSKTDSFDANTKLNPKEWAEEGLAISKSFVYSTPEFQQPDANYLAKCRSICLHRVAMAGIRLAHLINSLIGK